MSLFRKNNLSEIYAKFTSHKISFEGSLLDVIPFGEKRNKSQIIFYFEEVIKDSDSKKLIFCIAAGYRDGIDSDYIDLFDQVILADWHEEHEDIVDIIYQFKDDRFSHALYQIATNESVYRKYDDENESTLRKCIHALKEIDSTKANKIIEKLRKSKNPNIEFVLELYNT